MIPLYTNKNSFEPEIKTIYSERYYNPQKYKECGVRHRYVQKWIISKPFLPANKNLSAVQKAKGLTETQKDPRFA